MSEKNLTATPEIRKTSQPDNPPKIGFVSLGCPKNLVDSEVMMGMLASGGAQITARAEDADIIVVNTCSRPIASRGASRSICALNLRRCRVSWKFWRAKIFATLILGAFKCPSVLRLRWSIRLQLL